MEFGVRNKTSCPLHVVRELCPSLIYLNAEQFDEKS